MQLLLCNLHKKWSGGSPEVGSFQELGWQTPKCPRMNPSTKILEFFRVPEKWYFENREGVGERREGRVMQAFNMNVSVEGNFFWQKEVQISMEWWLGLRNFNGELSFNEWWFKTVLAFHDWKFHSAICMWNLWGGICISGTLWFCSRDKKSWKNVGKETSPHKGRPDSPKIAL